MGVCVKKEFQLKIVAYMRKIQYLKPKCQFLARSNINTIQQTSKKEYLTNEKVNKQTSYAYYQKQINNSWNKFIRISVNYLFCGVNNKRFWLEMEKLFIFETLCLCLKNL